KGHEKTVTDIFEKWDLPCAKIGHVTDDGMMRVKDHGKVVSEIPARQLAEDAPVYHREAREPRDIKQRRAFDFDKIREPRDYSATLLKLIASPTLASKRWVYRQYDHQVRLGTITLPGSDAAVIRVKTGDTWKYLAASVDCNAHYCYLDPHRGGLIAVAEAARN